MRFNLLSFFFFYGPCFLVLYLRNLCLICHDIFLLFISRNFIGFTFRSMIKFEVCGMCMCACVFMCVAWLPYCSGIICSICWRDSPFCIGLFWRLCLKLNVTIFVWVHCWILLCSVGEYDYANTKLCWLLQLHNKFWN